MENQLKTEASSIPSFITDREFGPENKYDQNRVMLLASKFTFSELGNKLDRLRKAIPDVYENPEQYPEGELEKLQNKEHELAQARLILSGRRGHKRLFTKGPQSLPFGSPSSGMSDWKEEGGKDVSESILDFPHKTLSPYVWDMKKNAEPSVKSEVKNAIDDRIEELKFVLKEAGETEAAETLDEAILNILIMGSIAGYQWNKETDIDTKLVLKPSWSKEHREALMNAIDETNEQLLPETTHPLNFYPLTPEDAIQFDKADNIYSVSKDLWIKPPDEVITLPEEGQLKVAEKWAEIIDTEIGKIRRAIRLLKRTEEYSSLEGDSLPSDYAEEAAKKAIGDIESALSYLKFSFELVKENRRIVYASDVEKPSVSSQNLVFKYLQANGYLQVAKQAVDMLDEGWTVNGLSSFVDEALDLYPCSSATREE